MLFSTKSKCHKSNFCISWTYWYHFYDLKVYFWCLTSILKFDKACLNTREIPCEWLKEEQFLVHKVFFKSGFLLLWLISFQISHIFLGMKKLLTWISTNKSNVGISILNQWCIVEIEKSSSDSSDEASWLPHFIIDFFILISLYSHSRKLSKWINVFYKWHLTLWHYLEIRPGRYEIRPVISLRPLALRTEVRGDFNIHGTKYF